LRAGSVFGIGFFRNVIVFAPFPAVIPVIDPNDGGEKNKADGEQNDYKNEKRP
jgi:hypothetical protein